MLSPDLSTETLFAPSRAGPLEMTPVIRLVAVVPSRAIVCEGLELKIDNLKAHFADGVAASKFENVFAVVIRNLPVLER